MSVVTLQHSDRRILTSVTRVDAGALPLIDLLVRDRYAAELDRTAIRELVQSRATNVECVPPGRVNCKDVDALAGLGVGELPARPAVGGVEVGWEGTSDVWERGEAVEGREPWCRGRVSG